MIIRNQRAFASGALLLLIATVYFFLSFNYDFGTPSHMGPAFFPRLVSAALAVIALAVVLGSISPTASIEQLERWGISRLAWIVGSVVAFGFLLPTFGLVLALIILVLVSSYASPEFTWRGALVNTIALVVLSICIFVFGINLQLPMWPL